MNEIQRLARLSVGQNEPVMVNTKSLLEWSGCATGLAGAFVLAMNQPWSGWGWALFLLSNVAWIAFGLLTKAKGLVVMQCGFAFTSALGIWNCLM